MLWVRGKCKSKWTKWSLQSHVREDGSKASVQKITFSGGGPLLCLHQKCCYIRLCWCFKMFKMFILIGLQSRLKVRGFFTEMREMIEMMMMSKAILLISSPAVQVMATMMRVMRMRNWGLIFTNLWLLLSCQFGGQEPGTAQEVETWAREKYGASWYFMEKVFKVFQIFI